MFKTSFLKLTRQKRKTSSAIQGKTYKKEAGSEISDPAFFFRFRLLYKATLYASFSSSGAASDIHLAISGSISERAKTSTPQSL